MANRPVFIPSSSSAGVDIQIVEFDWFPGLSSSQKRKSITALHSAASALGIFPLLEISTKSAKSLGVKLSAFNLLITTQSGKAFSVETAFQGSKVFQHDGPFIDLLGGTSREAKKDVRLKESGDLVGFEFFKRAFPLKPRTLFYDWLYINALFQNENLERQVVDYGGFTDIEFNPSKSINCQAYSAALYVSLKKSGHLVDALESPETFGEVLEQEYSKRDNTLLVQGTLI